MKANITRGGGFRGALNYVFDAGPKATHTKKAELVGGNVIGDNPMALAREFAVVRILRPDIKKPVWHCSLALSKDERLSTEKWNEVARDFMGRMGFEIDKRPYVVVRHNDTNHDHIHIIASRIALDGSVWLGRWEARHAIEATQELEKKHGLIVTPGLGDARAERKKSSRNETKLATRTRQEPPRERLQRLIDGAVKGEPSALEFAQRLEAVGVNARVNLASTGRLNGFSFEIGGIHFKGQDLGEVYKWNGLQKRGVTYEKERDSAGLERFRAAAAVRKVHGGDDRPVFVQAPRPDLWRAYQAWNQQRSQQLDERRTVQRESEKVRRTAVKSSFEARRTQLNAERSAGNAAQIRAQLSIARMERATSEVALREQIDRERAELKAARNRPYAERYLDFLAERAQTGDELALAELRRMQHDKPRPIEGSVAVQSAEYMSAAVRDPFHEDIALSHVVHVNGDVSYSRGADKIIVDRRHEVALLRQDDKTIETALRFAIARWGNRLDMAGTDELKRRVAELAAEKHMNITFADPAMNAIVAERRQQIAQASIRRYKSLGDRAAPLLGARTERDADQAPEPQEQPQQTSGGGARPRG
ncbi:relaxase/mobilization nuclease domain-containing protein [Paraburkholderia sp. GAS42]|uniref:relaxase/mobilization nuclease domain-containing protein n=1 Tax=Paraburkholderia sp. GAS42 TaxID=3035135 RepID=UPI003D1B2F1B